MLWCPGLLKIKFSFVTNHYHKDYVRIVITIPDTEIPEVVRRIVEFCAENCEKEKEKPQNRRVSAFLIGGSTGL